MAWMFWLPSLNSIYLLALTNGGGCQSGLLLSCQHPTGAARLLAPKKKYRGRSLVMVKPTLTCDRWCNLTLGRGYTRGIPSQVVSVCCCSLVTGVCKVQTPNSSARQAFSTPLLESACFMNPKQRANHECARLMVQLGDLPQGLHLATDSGPA